METIEIRPEKEQQTMWFVIWAIWSMAGLALWVVLLLAVPSSEEETRLALAICLAVTVVVIGLILIWIPVFYRSLEYEICSDSVKMKGGVIWKRRVTVPFPKITNVDVTQGPLQRAFNLGTIHVQTAGAGGTQGARAEVILMGVRNLEGVREKIMERAKGYTGSRSEEVKEKTVEVSDSDVLRRMLDELGAIRETLEKKQI
jgi:membrane protein YdbS with pleckstrin-like domain